MQGLRPFFRYFDFTGRSGRAEYWQFLALCFLISAFLSLIEFGSIIQSAAAGVPKVPVWSSIFGLLTFIPSTAAMFRRLHDRNKSGWLIGGIYAMCGVAFALLMIAAVQEAAGSESSVAPLLLAVGIVILILSIYVIVQLALPGDEHENDFGWPDNEPFDLQAKFSGSRMPARAAVAATPRAPRVQVEDSLGRIERLADLHAKGHLTTEEFAAQKARLLEAMA